MQAFSWLGFNTNWYLLFPECFFILSVVFVFQNCLCWFLHYESHPVGKRILRCHPFWYLGCYPSHVVWNFSPTNLYWCIFWLQGEGRALWIHFWNTLVFCSWAIESLIQELVWLKYSPVTEMMFQFLMIWNCICAHKKSCTKLFFWLLESEFDSALVEVLSACFFYLVALHPFQFWSKFNLCFCSLR